MPGPVHELYRSGRKSPQDRNARTLVLLLMLAAVAPALVAGQCWSTTSAAYSYNRVEEGETLTFSNYQNSESCWFYFRCPSTSDRARLDFQSINTESCCDHVRVYDGDYTQPECRISSHSGTSTPSDKTSLNRYAWINFVSDGTVTRGSDGGFRVTLECSSSYSSSRSSYSSCTAPPASSCSYGQYLSSGSCRDCGSGRYQDRYSHTDSSCDDCPSGKYQSSTGGSSCDYCPSGKYQEREGYSSCDYCPSGKYQEYEGADSCYSCPSGQYQSSTGSDSCRDCPSGKSSSYESDSSSDCLADGVTTYDMGYGSYYDADAGTTVYYDSASSAEQARAEAASELGDAVCDQISDYGCVLYPDCCGFVSSHRAQFLPRSYSCIRRA